MSGNTGRTSSFKKRISIERETLGAANEFSDRHDVLKLLGLSHAAIQSWVDGLSSVISSRDLQHIEECLRELSRATGLLSDESRCAVAEGKVSSDFPELLVAFKRSLINAETTKVMSN